MSDSKKKKTCFIIALGYHIIAAENIFENNGLGNDHEKVIQFKGALTHLPRFGFLKNLLPVKYLVITSKSLKAKRSFKGKGA